jgi:hypothetical protein
MEASAYLEIPEQKVVISPYARGVFPKDMLYHLWRMMADDDTLARVFYHELTEEGTRGDLAMCLKYFNESILFLALQELRVIGAVWFTNIATWRGDIGFAYRRKTPRPLTEAITDRTCKFVFAYYGWTDIWGFTPWRAALEHGLRTGFTHVATLPEYVLIAERLRPVYVGRRRAKCQLYPMH